MLTELTIENLGLVEHGNLQFSPGFNVITGETGAGKSTLLNALKLISGGRAEARLVSEGALSAVVDSCWEFHAEDHDTFAKHEVELSGDELFISRSLKSDGKSRLTLNGRPVPNSLVNEFSHLLVEVHGQSEQLTLRDPHAQRKTLDSFAGEEITSVKSAFEESYRAWRALVKRQKALAEDSGKRTIEIQYNKTLMEKFLELDPLEGEIESSEAEIEKLSHLEEITENIRSVMNMCIPEEGESPSEVLEQIADLVRRIARHDGDLEPIQERFEQALDLIDEATKGLESYADTVDLDSLSTLRDLEDRLVDLRSFAKPFGGDLERAIEASLKAQEFLAENDEEIDLDALAEEVEAAHETMIRRGAKLTEARKLAAEKLTDAVNVELRGLAMKGVQLHVSISEGSPAIHGLDTVELMVRTKNSQPRPIAKAASGGELSRIMLALELVAADPSNPCTLVFDEIDTGVGGSTAIEIGRRLAELAKSHQVILVSHLAQVAAWAENHFVLSKEETEDSVETSITCVTGDERVTEIARLLSGMSDSTSAREHALELLENSKIS